MILQQYKIVFAGSMGAGKTEAIRSLSDIEVLDTDVQATDETALLKEKTTVSMDVGVLNLGDGDKLRLSGAPGQERFDLMWEILAEQCKGVVVLLNHAYFGYYASGGAVGVGEAVGRSMRTSLISNVVVVLLFSLALYGTDPNFNLTV